MHSFADIMFSGYNFFLPRGITADETHACVEAYPHLLYVEGHAQPLLKFIINETHFLRIKKKKMKHIFSLVKSVSFFAKLFFVIVGRRDRDEEVAISSYLKK